MTTEKATTEDTGAEETDEYQDFLEDLADTSEHGRAYLLENLSPGEVWNRFVREGLDGFRVATIEGDVLEIMQNLNDSDAHAMGCSLMVPVLTEAIGDLGVDTFEKNVRVIHATQVLLGAMLRGVMVAKYGDHVLPPAVAEALNEVFDFFTTVEADLRETYIAELEKIALEAETRPHITTRIAAEVVHRQSLSTQWRQDMFFPNQEILRGVIIDAVREGHRDFETLTRMVLDHPDDTGHTALWTEGEHAARQLVAATVADAFATEAQQWDWMVLFGRELSASQRRVMDQVNSGALNPRPINDSIKAISRFCAETTETLLFQYDERCTATSKRITAARADVLETPASKLMRRSKDELLELLEVARLLPSDKPVRLPEEMTKDMIIEELTETFGPDEMEEGELAEGLADDFEE